MARATCSGEGRQIGECTGSDKKGLAVENSPSQWPAYFAWRWTVGAYTGASDGVNSSHEPGWSVGMAKKSAGTVTSPETAGGNKKQLDHPIGIGCLVFDTDR